MKGHFSCWNVGSHLVCTVSHLLSVDSRWASCQTSGKPTCEGTICADGVCVLLQVTCSSEPCYPMPYCVAEAGG
jgi:hypothetical protein